MLLLLAAVPFSACRSLLTRLDRQETPLPQEVEEPRPVVVHMATCWAGLPLAEGLVAAYLTQDPPVSFDIIPCNSSLAENLVAAGQADLAIVVQAPAAETAGQSEGVASQGPAGRVVAMDAIGIIVHTDSALADLTMEELADLFAGYHLDWQELDTGYGRPEIVTREEGSALRTIFEQTVMGERSISSAAILMPHERGMVEYVAEHQNAIGYVSRVWADDSVKLVPIEGSAPAASEIEGGRYPLSYCLAMVISADAPSEASLLVSFAMSDAEHGIIEEHYLLPR